MITRKLRLVLRCPEIVFHIQHIMYDTKGKVKTER